MRTSNFALFLLVSFGISVPLFFISTWQTSPIVTVVLFLLGSYAPALGAWLALARADAKEKQEFRSRLRGWGGKSWVWFALLAPSVAWLVAFGVSALNAAVEEPLWLYIAFLPVVLLVNFGEELGWRAYALPYLIQRFNPLTASLVLGVIWALFHAVLYIQTPKTAFLSSIGILLLSLLLAWMFLNTRSILPGTLFHAVYNVWGYVFSTAQDRDSLLMIVIALLGVLTARVVFRRGRTLLVTQ